MSDLITNELNRMVDSAWDRSRKRGESLREMKEGIEEKQAEALDLISEKKKPVKRLTAIEEAFNQAKENKS
jgi:predicted  nucleic acid-binding Zn-ribbon protein